MVGCHNVTIILAQTVNSEYKNAYIRYAECNMSSVVMLIVAVKKSFVAEVQQFVFLYSVKLRN